jgi:hypothetical protein
MPLLSENVTSSQCEWAKGKASQKISTLLSASLLASGQKAWLEEDKRWPFGHL